MKKSYLDLYYPDGLSAEERLFEEGRRLTSVPLNICVITAVGGFTASVLGALIAIVVPVLGLLLSGLGSLALAIGLIGIGMYRAGLRALERAELLYNTRLAGAEDPDVKQEFYTAQKQPFWKAASGGSKEEEGWTCSCGKTHPPYAYLCDCGKSKAEAAKK